MERVTGIGSLFFRARDPDALARWYQLKGVPDSGSFTPSSWPSASGNPDGGRQLPDGDWRSGGAELGHHRRPASGLE
jgi:hypothetical protein